MFEKLLSGLYLGEVARCILLTLAKDPELALFGSAEDGRPFVPGALSQPGSFPTSTLSAVVDDRSLFGSKAAAAMCESLGLPSVTQEARSVVRQSLNSITGHPGTHPIALLTRSSDHHLLG